MEAVSTLFYGVKNLATQTAALAALGLVLEQPESDPVQTVWPENWAGLRVFARLRTQWNVGNAGAIGLNYSSLQFWLDVEEVPRTDWHEVTADVQDCEVETLRLMREKN